MGSRCYGRKCKSDAKQRQRNPIRTHAQTPLLRQPTYPDIYLSLPPAPSRSPVEFHWGLPLEAAGREREKTEQPRGELFEPLQRDTPSREAVALTVTPTAA